MTGHPSREVEDYAATQLHYAGRDAVIQAAFYGDRGGVMLRNINSSFLDFVAERFSRTSTERIAEPPDDWGGRAAVDWARRLSEGKGFDPEIERNIAVAAALDQIYARS